MQLHCFTYLTIANTVYACNSKMYVWQLIVPSNYYVHVLCGDQAKAVYSLSDAYDALNKLFFTVLHD